MSVAGRGPAQEARRAGRSGVRGAVTGGGALLVVVLLTGPAVAVESPAPEPAPSPVEQVDPAPQEEADPCATTNPDGTPKEPDVMCQSGMPVDAPPPVPTQDVLPRTGTHDRLLALTALGSGLVLAGAGAAVAGRRRSASEA